VDSLLLWRAAPNRLVLLSWLGRICCCILDVRIGDSRERQIEREEKRRNSPSRRKRKRRRRRRRRRKDDDDDDDDKGSSFSLCRVQGSDLARKFQTWNCRRRRRRR